MASSDKSESFSSSSKSTLNIPNNARNVKIFASGGAGGNGGDDSDNNGGDGKNGREADFSFKSKWDWRTYQLEIWVGKAGDDGEKNATGKGGGDGGSGGADGGDGGDAAPFPYSGGGGGGGGASVVKINWPGPAPESDATIIVAGGGGGGGGASKGNPGKDGELGGSFDGTSGNFDGDDGSDGSTIGSCNGSPNDGGGGGGGGGGSPGGSGGDGGSDDNFCDEKAEGGDGGGSKYSTTYLTKSNEGTNSGDGEVEVEWEEVDPEIEDWYADPETQDSSLGTPLYSTSLYWSGQDYDWAGYRIRKLDGNLTNNNYTKITSSPITINNLPQSNADGTSGAISPRNLQYQLKLCIGGEDGNCVTENLTVKVKNDCTHTNSWTTTHGPFEPLTVKTEEIGTLSGVDMNVEVSSPSSGVTFNNSGTGTFSNPKLVPPGSSIYMKMTTKNWNTSLTGITVNDSKGNENLKTVSVTVGCSPAFDVTFKTKAPTIKELFNMSGETNKLPHPDIDVVETPDPDEYLFSPDVDINNVDIDVVVRSSNPDIQVKVNNGNWKNVQNLNPKRLW